MYEKIPTSIDLGDVSLQGATDDELIARLGDWQCVSFRVPLPSINRTNEPINIVYDYLYASYGIEMLSKECVDCSLKFEWETKYFPVLILTLIEPNRIALLGAIRRAIWAFQSAEEQSYEEESQAEIESIDEYQQNLNEIQLNFPEVVEQYFANLVNGAYFQSEYELAKGIKEEFPERTYGFWKSAFYNGKEPRVYVSENAWIIPSEIPAEAVFKNFAYDGEISLLNASLIFHGGKVLAISEGIALEISLEVFLQTISCAEEMYYPKDVFTFKFAWQSRYFLTSLAENGHWPPLEGDEKKHRLPPAAKCSVTYRNTLSS